MKDLPIVCLSKRLIRDDEKHIPFLHPWIFSGAIAKFPENVVPGTIVRVLDSNEKFVGYGHFNPVSKIAIRLLSTHEDLFPNESYFASKITAAVNLRKSLPINSNARRLVYSESDCLPGLIVDQYADMLVIQTLTAGMDSIKNFIANTLVNILSPLAIIERNDCEIRKLEGLKPTKSILYGDKNALSEIEIFENGLKFVANPFYGQKTGFYMDQRDNRLRVKSFVRPNMEILDCFCCSGAFSVYCASAEKVSLTLLDESEEALNIAKKNLEINGIDTSKVIFTKGDAFKILRQFRDSRRSFDLIILDPPKFAPTASDADKACRGYKDINLLAMKLLRNGGILASFSCSSGVNRERFMSTIISAARDSGRKVQLLAELGQPPDHPIILSFPESAYLKGCICRII
ncbi:MAG: class I SAM-dependent rRNA methyltransferase [Candidatus Nanoarchaeia archaeon]